MIINLFPIKKVDQTMTIMLDQSLSTIIFQGHFEYTFKDPGEYDVEVIRNRIQ